MELHIYHHVLNEDPRILHHAAGRIMRDVTKIERVADELRRLTTVLTHTGDEPSKETNR